MSRALRRSVPDRVRIAVGRVLAATGVLLAAYGLITLWFTGHSEFITRDYVAPTSLLAFGFGTMSWIAIRRQPRNAVVWVSCVAALSVGSFSAFVAIALLLSGLGDSQIPITALAAMAPVDLPTSAAIMLQAAQWVWIPGFALTLTVGLLLFPGGRMPSPRWSWVAWAAWSITTALCVIVAWTFRPGSTLPVGSSSDEYPGVGRFVDPLFGALFLCSGLCIAGLIVKFRRSSGAERMQYLWVAWGGSVFAAVLVVSALVRPVISTAPPAWVLISALIGEVFLVGSYATAILKYRLYDIDVVISRTLVFVVLAGFITLVYASIVVGIGGFVGRDSESLFLPIAATAVVAVAFEPVRHRAQGWANRLVLGTRATPYQVLADLTERLSKGEPGDGLLGRMAARLGEGTGAERATIWLGSDGSGTVGASWPDEASPGPAPDLETAHVFPVSHDSDVVGAFELVKPRGSTLTKAERSLVTSLAGSVGAVLGYQRLNDSLKQKAIELAQSRARLVDAQDAERRRLEVDLNEGAQQMLLALKVKIDLARSMAAGHHADDLESLLSGLSDGTQEALDEVRDLAQGIYPPVLESDGLAAAVSGLAAGSPVEVSVDSDGIGRYPPDVEAAVYFDVSEAVTNAVKHAEGPIHVALSEDDGMLRFQVSDCGPGFDPARIHGGSGLENMADRLDAIGGSLTIASHPGQGTSVSGEVPRRPPTSG